ncbi:winged helix-turn-helix transcriptional regulator [Acanthopleuribacter pedis]|uniref:Helix-turn-helix transcriptional regulator n=1 Tax=Acanthopleuribacter pedis TaxID=442870 RepID=A0A8J7U2T6_9BACT|nr:helix-turn-helix domain-containing protein [Acanthopleuribacter pedis]MBO1319653.1 helix-turn-helix transcriptional regulator [Acanthopleuribacter pedis]
MSRKRGYHQRCSLARALDVIGERWTMLLIRNLLAGPRRYKDLAADLPAMGTNLLASRLKHLEAHGLVEQALLPPPLSVKAYRLTEDGLALAPALAALAHWGMRLPPGESDAAWSPQWNALAFRARFRPETCLDRDEKYGFVIGDYHHTVHVHHGQMTYLETLREDAAFVLSAAAANFQAVFADGTLPLETALERGVLTLSGDRAAFVRCLATFAP